MKSEIDTFDHECTDHCAAEGFTEEKPSKLLTEALERIALQALKDRPFLPQSA